MMVGEIRDLETAEIAVHASLTGHLVLSTLHTNDAPSAVARLVDMGIEPFLVSSSLVCILAQRLVRELCPYCKEAYTPSHQEIDFLALDSPPAQLYRGKGCDRCLEKGYLGRTGIYEFLEVGPEIRGLIGQRKDAQVIGKTAFDLGFKPMYINGIDKIISGDTTIDEVLRVTHSSNVAESP